MEVSFIVNQNPNEYPSEEKYTNFWAENTGRRVSFKVDDDRFANVELRPEAESDTQREDETSKKLAPIAQSVRELVKSM